MSKKIKLFMYTNLFSILTVCSAFASKTVKASGWNMGPPPVGAPVDFDDSLLRGINWILGFTAAVATLALIWGGMQYMTSAGDTSKAETGKKTISYAVIGLIVAGLAYAIVNIVVTKILV
ncbi:MAG: hypothetical protein KAI71_03465 [Candidatus Pacebacteria bacterium]|nr:hypothetical protein [Candidatus Paceibacterota bacterium]